MLSKCWARFGFTAETYPDHHIAAWLHDVLEDTDTQFIQLYVAFPEASVDLVYRVTNEGTGNRKEKFAKTTPKLRGHIGAAILKLAGRIANVEQSIQDNPKMLKMYRKEYPEFRQTLHAEAIETKAMWAHLDDLLGYKRDNA